MKFKVCVRVEYTSNMSRDIGYLQVVCQSSKLRKKIDTHGPVPLLHQRLRGFQSLRIIVLPTAPHNRGHHYHIKDKQPLPLLQMTPLPSTLPSSRGFPQRPSPQQNHSTYLRYRTRQHPSLSLWELLHCSPHCSLHQRPIQNTQTASSSVIPTTTCSLNQAHIPS